MDPLAQKRRRRGRYLFWSLVALLVLVPICGVLYATFGPNPPILVSKATTYITTPLADDGLPDYAAALLADMRKGVTPENNGAVPLLQALLNNTALTPGEAQALCTELGVEYPIPNSRPLTPTRAIQSKATSHLKQRLRETGFDAGKEIKKWAGDELISIATKRPWSRDDLPFLADWLSGNRQSIDLLVEASERPRWHCPSPDLLSGEINTSFDESDDGQVLNRGNPATALALRANHDLTAGQDKLAARHAVAIMRIGRHATSQPFAYSNLIGHRYAATGCSILHRLAADPATKADDLRSTLDMLQSIGPPDPPPVELMLQCERFRTLGSAIRTKRTGLKESAFDLSGSHPHALRAAELRIDWNQSLATINAYFDQITSTYSLPTLVARRNALLAIEAEIEARQDDRSTWRLYTPEGRSGIVADLFLSRDGYAEPEIAYSAGHLNRTLHDLVILHLAIALFQKEHRSYPEALESIVPSVLPELPADPFYGNSYVYRRTEDGFLLYSLGSNGLDDGGSCSGANFDDEAKSQGFKTDWLLGKSEGTLTPEEQTAYDLIEKIPPGADDASLRVPLPVEPWPWEE